MSPLLEVHGLTKRFRVRRGLFGHSEVRAVEGIDLTLADGEALGIVGESGSGKTTLARMILGLTPPSAGVIRFSGRKISGLSEASLRPLRREMQIIFQNPHSSLDPRMTVFDSVAEPLVIQERLRGAPLRARVEKLLFEVSLPRQFLYRYPHELSGGQKQRVSLARALSLAPRLVVLDEPTSALDVSVQAQILEFLRELRTRHGLSYVLISHNLAVVRHLCERIAVMYLGRFVEVGPTELVLADPQHPYTRDLVAAVPRQHAGILSTVQAGEVASQTDPPLGCGFHPRCRHATDICRVEKPDLRLVENRGVACHLAPIARSGASPH